MFEFKILKKSKKSLARLGIIKTPHGEIETPALVPVATQATIKTLDSKEVENTKTQILICNTFHLHLKPGEEIVAKNGGLHNFMSWKKPLMTDSGGFQVFSLGFGFDLKIGKIAKYFPEKEIFLITKHSQPQNIKITKEGILFKSPYDGKTVFLGPKESMKIQKKLGADIIFAFDECTPPLCSFEYAKEALKRTHYWAKICLAEKSKNQALFGIVQGSRFKKLRQESAGFLNSLEFDGFGIGGDLGKSKKDIFKILNWSVPILDERKPRHLLGVGHLEDIEKIMKLGIDLFDCTVPTHYGRHGIAFTSFGKLNLKKSLFLKDKNPLDKNCNCLVCQNFKRSYICHLIRAEESTGKKLLSFHNLYYFNNFVAKIREKIKKGKI